MADLKRQYDEKLRQKEELRKKSDFMEMMLDRASQLVSGLIGEKERWENTVTVCQILSVTDIQGGPEKAEPQC